MTAQEIMFKIGSEFSGEGFKRAKQDIGEVNSNIKKGVSAASQLSGAFGQLDSSCAKSLNAMVGFAEALVSFNVTAIATQVAMFAINKYFGELKEKVEEAKKRVEELKVATEKAFSNELTSQITAVNKEVNSLIGDFERITKQANAFTAALEGVRQSEANGGVINLQLEKVNAMLEAHSEAERQTIESTYNLKIAIEKSANTHADWLAKQEAAHQAIIDSQNRMAKTDEQLAALAEKRHELEQVMISAKESEDPHWRDIQKQINGLLDKEAELEQKKLDIESEIDVLREKEKQTKQDAINAETQATIAVREAELAEQKLTEAKHNRKVKEEAAKDAAELKEASDRDAAKETKTAAQIQADANNAAKELVEAEKNYAKKLAEFNAGDLVREAAKELANNGGLDSQGLLPVDVQKSIQTTVADAKVDDAIRNGAITTVKEADKLQRQAMRDARDTITKEQKQQLAEAKKYKRLQEMNPKALASSDKEFMRKYEKIQQAAEKRKQDLEKAKKAVEDQKKKVEENTKTLQNIEKQLKNLGLK